MDAIVPFVACGDLSGKASRQMRLDVGKHLRYLHLHHLDFSFSCPGYDADASYPLDLDERGAEGASADAKPGAKYEYRAPPQPPINPPYKEYLDRKHAGEAEGDTTRRDRKRGRSESSGAEEQKKSDPEKSADTEAASAMEVDLLDDPKAFWKKWTEERQKCLQHPSQNGCSCFEGLGSLM
eukprot:scaffold407_cov251-Pinguiococcus_pyrenoidosus.AAC.12